MNPKSLSRWRFPLSGIPRTARGVTSAQSASTLRAWYARIAHVYDAVVPYVSEEARTEALSRLNVTNGEQVLDLGTGTGLALLSLAGGNSKGWTEGVDLSTEMLRRARRRMKRIPHARYGLRQADATSLPYPDDSFDVVCSSYLLDVLPPTDRHEALQEMKRVLRSGGRVGAVTLTRPERALERLWVGMARALPFLAGGARPVTLRPSLQDTGFIVTDGSTHCQAGLRSAVYLATLG